MKNRKVHIELIRVIAMGMTIMIHIANLYITKYPNVSDVDFLFSVIYGSLARVCVPLFFMISGIFLIKSEHDTKKYWTRIGRFILVLIFWSIIYYLDLYGFTTQKMGKVIVYSIFSPNLTSRHLWYMYAMLGLYIALPFIQNMCKNMSRQQENLFLGLWMVLSGLDSVYIPIARSITGAEVSVSYPVPIVNATYYMGYFVCGYILYNRFKEWKGTTKRNLLCVGAYVLSIALTVVITFYKSEGQGRFYDAMTWYRGILVIVAAVSLFLLVVMNGERIKGTWILGTARLAFGVYLIHYLFVLRIQEYMMGENYPAAVFVPLVTLGVYLASLGCCWVIKKIPILKELV